MTRLFPLFTLLLLFLPGCLSPEARLQQGDDYYQRGQYANALRAYQTARRDNPDLPGIDEKIHNAQVRVYFAQGDRLVARHRWDEARRSYEEVRRLEPGNTEVDERLAHLKVARADYHFARGQQLLNQGNPFDALGEFEQALVYQPEHMRAKRALALARQKKLERERRAETCYQNGVRARATRRYEDAARDFAQALQLNPHHPSAALDLRNVEATLVDAWISDGDAEMASRHFEQALGFYRKAYERNPNVPGLVARIGQAEGEQQAAQIVAEGDRCLDNRQWQQAYDKFYEAQRMTAEPEALEERLERARNGYAEEVYSTAILAEKSGRYEDALAGFASVLEVYPTFRDVAARHRTLSENLRQAESAYSAGCSAQGMRNLLGARDQFQTCVRILPVYRDAAQRLAEVNGSIAMADRLYERGKQAERRREFSRARMLYEECLALTHPFHDVRDRMIGMRRRTRPKFSLPQYEAACEAQSQSDLRKARDLFLSVQRKRHGHRDTVKRLSDIDAALAKAQSYYRKGVHAERLCQLNVARDHYLKTLSICNPYEDAKARLVGVNATLHDIRVAQRYDRGKQLLMARKYYQKAIDRHPVPVARQRVQTIDQICAALERSYARMVKAARSNRYRRALGLALGIRKQCADYQDVAQRIGALELEADYADGQALIAQGRRDAAIKCFERVSQRDPKFKDVEKLLEEYRGPGRHHGRGHGRGHGKKHFAGPGAGPSHR